MSESLLRKPLTGILLLAGAAGGPYVMMETDAGRSASQMFSSTETPVANAPLQPTPAAPSTAAGSQPWETNLAGRSGNLLNSDSGNLMHSPVLSLAEVFRFDISPTWVTGRFPRVSTIVGDGQLDGMRVPLVTGTTPSDLAGTLTYYFDNYQRLQRISLQSVTGDPNRFVSQLQQAYQMQQQPALGGNLYLLSWNGQPTSVLRISPAAVIRADSPYSRFDLFLELNQPGLQYGLSADARGLLDAGRATRRW